VNRLQLKFVSVTKAALVTLFCYFERAFITNKITKQNKAKGVKAVTL
jgi:hypothetical protein